MGIQGLLQFLDKASRKCHISEFRDSSIAVDSYCLLHKGSFACAEQLVMGKPTFAHIAYCLKYVKMLLDHGIKPIMVFDGRHLPAKKEVEIKRHSARKLAKKRAAELLREDKPEQARNYFRQCVNITHDMALALIKECRKIGVDCIVAPYEADAQLAYLNKIKVADAVLTEDSDLVLFGCDKIIFKMDLSGCGTLVEAEKLYLPMKMRPELFSFEKFRHMCILSGCDYLNSLPGIGLKKAHKFITATANPDIYSVLLKLPAYLNMRSLVVPDEYRVNFMIADATFRHQLVFDPLRRKLVPLTPADTTNPQFCSNAGEQMDSEVAYQLALGNLDPHNLDKVDDWCPDSARLSSSSIWSTDYSPTHKKVSRFIIKTEIRSNTTLETTSANLPNTPTTHQDSGSPSLRRLSKFPRTVLDQTVTVKSRFFREQNAKEFESIIYDEKLTKDIHNMYKSEPVISVKRPRCEEDSSETDTSPVLSNRINPFLKVRKVNKLDLDLQCEGEEGSGVQGSTSEVNLVEVVEDRGESPADTGYESLSGCSGTDSQKENVVEEPSATVSLMDRLQKFRKSEPIRKGTVRKPGLSRVTVKTLKSNQTTLRQLFGFKKP